MKYIYIYVLKENSFHTLQIGKEEKAAILPSCLIEAGSVTWHSHLALLSFADNSLASPVTQQSLLPALLLS